MGVIMKKTLVMLGLIIMLYLVPSVLAQPVQIGCHSTIFLCVYDMGNGEYGWQTGTTPGPIGTYNMDFPANHLLSFPTADPLVSQLAGFGTDGKGNFYFLNPTEVTDIVNGGQAAIGVGCKYFQPTIELGNFYYSNSPLDCGKFQVGYGPTCPIIDNATVFDSIGTVNFWLVSCDAQGNVIVAYEVKLEKRDLPPPAPELPETCMFLDPALNTYDNPIGVVGSKCWAYQDSVKTVIGWETPRNAGEVRTINYNGVEYANVPIIATSRHYEWGTRGAVVRVVDVVVVNGTTLCVTYENTTNPATVNTGFCPGQ